MKVNVRSKKIAGWIVEFTGEELDAIKSFCEENSEDIEFFLGGPEEEETVQEVLDDECWDLYDAASSSDLGVGGFYPLYDKSSITIKIQVGENVLKIDPSEVIIEKETVSINEWNEEGSGEEAVAYGFGYISDDVMDSTYEIEGIEDFDPKKLKMKVISNDFLESEYIYGFVYEREGGNNESYYLDDDDFEGEYFPSRFFKKGSDHI